MTKRDLEEESSDDDFGPKPAGEEEDQVGPLPVEIKKRRGIQLLIQVDHEELYLSNLPNTDSYEVSLMHRDTVILVFITKTDFLITCSVDGHVKFWKKTEKGIEFVKHFRAHLGLITSGTVSFDGLLFCSCSIDKTLKIFDVVNFDMINMIKTEYIPNTSCFAYQKGQAVSLLAVTGKEDNLIYFYDGKTSQDVIRTISVFQTTSIILYNPVYDVVLGCDDRGLIEYFILDLDSETGFKKPDNLKWKLKSDTDLYEFKKQRLVPTSIVFSNDYKMFSVWEFKSRILRIFNFETGKIIKKIDESLQLISEKQQESEDRMDDMEFGRRLALEREFEKPGQGQTCNSCFDETNTFIIYPTMFGIKMVNLKNDNTVLIGKSETIRFMNICLYQGQPKKKQLVTIEMAASENTVLRESEETDPTIFCTSYKKNRFYSFTRREPDSSATRDIFNERPTREEGIINQQNEIQQQHGTEAMIHTSYGDIILRLYPEYAPKACQNFVELSQKGYYDGCHFHRVIKNFMVQTGDPLNDGTGGESIFGKDFEDEFHPFIRHDRPYMVSMANSGPNTNGSQFFITVAPCPWLDNKHSIFGKAVSGHDVIHRIENVDTDKYDRPWDPIKIIGVEIR
ncbi:Peptidylprolyl isomerase domain and WD repeat containing protein 1 [Boothiomyces sp. JEL0838]|nr:Peptidylprolyl isomerase domain and WD repeat containing protein 1 [Boothiomyces sp. JEL0838]